MINCKEEFLFHIKDKHVKCALISGNIDYILKVGYTQQEWNSFLEQLNFEYDDGFGTQFLYGIIWYDNTWSERCEYDGSEWWEYREYPEIDASIGSVTIGDVAPPNGNGSCVI
jgi:hypothetical protein